MNFIQLKHDLKQDVKRQAVLEELHDYHNIKAFVYDYHIKTIYRHCEKAELKTFTWRTPQRMKKGRWCTCKRRIVDLPHKTYTHVFISVVRKNKNDNTLGGGFRNYKEELKWSKRYHGSGIVGYVLYDATKF